MALSPKLFLTPRALQRNAVVSGRAFSEVGKGVSDTLADGAGEVRSSLVVA
jgi:hypothetical protein